MKHFFIVLYLCLFSTQLLAGVIAIELADETFKYTPADDLIANGTPINAREAIHLANRGLDLSTLDPEPSTLYNPNQYGEIPNIDIDATSMNYQSPLSAPTEFFRASVIINGDNYTISASLYNHQTLLRAALLKMIGYQVAVPQYLPKFTLNFESIAEKDIFLESLTQSTLLSIKRWAPNLNEEKESLSVTLKGFILEPADLKTVPVYWPVMERSRQKSRRVFRSLLYLYCLTDFSEMINDIPWELGKVFDNKLNLAHSYSSAFLDVTIDDLKWMHRKISELSVSDIHAALKFANYPYEIEQLLFEKLKSRINSVGRLLNLPVDFPVDTK